jgi:hypothetical protein
VGSLRSNVVFTCTTAAAARPQIGVTLPVDANLRTTAGTYTLTDTITPRNTSVAAACT